MSTDSGRWDTPLLSGDLFGPGGRLRAQCRLSDGADGALYDGKGLGTCYLGGVQPAQKGARRQTLPDDGRIRLRRASSTVKARWLSASRSMNSVFSKEEAGEQMKTILRAARLAPSAMNTQPWRFIVYSDRIYVFALKPAFRARASMRCANSASASCSPIMLAAEELWMELQTETEEHFAAKSYKMEIMWRR